MKFTIGAVIADRKLEIKSNEDLAELMKGMKMLLEAFMKLKNNIDMYTYKYPRPAVTADCIVITKEAEPKVLLVQRGNPPFMGAWAFPGGFMDMDETTEQCAIRELMEETGLHVSDVHQIGAYSKVDRDPRGRTVTVAYLAIIDEPIAVTGLDDAAKAEWWSLSTLPHLAFDHYDIIQDAMKYYKIYLSQGL